MIATSFVCMGLFQKLRYEKRMSTINFTMEDMLKMCEAVHVAVTEGSGRVMVAGGENERCL